MKMMRIKPQNCLIALTKGRSQPATQNVEEVVEKVLTRTLCAAKGETTETAAVWAYQKSLEDAVKHGLILSILILLDLLSYAQSRIIER